MYIISIFHELMIAEHAFCCDSLHICRIYGVPTVYGKRTDHVMKFVSMIFVCTCLHPLWQNMREFVVTSERPMVVEQTFCILLLVLANRFSRTCRKLLENICRAHQTESTELILLRQPEERSLDVGLGLVWWCCNDGALGVTTSNYCLTTCYWVFSLRTQLECCGTMCTLPLFGDLNVEDVLHQA